MKDYDFLKKWSKTDCNQLKFDKRKKKFKK